MDAVDSFRALFRCFVLWGPLVLALGVCKVIKTALLIPLALSAPAPMASTSTSQTEVRAPQDAAGPLELALSAELERAWLHLSKQEEPPHYLALTIEDRQAVEVSAVSGTLSSSRSKHTREMDVDARVGTIDFDSSHPLRGMSALREDRRNTVALPLENHDGFALRHRIWREIDTAYRDAAERIVVLRANQNVKVAEETLAPDFEPRKPVVHRQVVTTPEIDVPAWEDRLVRLSAILDQSPLVHVSSAELGLVTVRKILADSEGSRLDHGGSWVRLGLRAETVAPDGDNLDVYRAFDFRNTNDLPSFESLELAAHELVSRLEALSVASRGEPYSGPVILKGKAAAVFFHEVMGHRVEGHRQKRDDEGKTFAEYVGRPVLPDFISVVDDPTLPRLVGVDLNGYFEFDDEGVPAERTVLVDHGVFKGFLMSRSPIPGFPRSNGHGRRQLGSIAIARMGNTLVEASRSVPEARLRAMLLDEVKRQGLPYGVIIEEIEGGFTMTGRVIPNAFNVRAVVSWKVFPDNRPDELVRGIDLVGTPLVAFTNIVAAGDRVEVFNGTCGAESGWVPVSAASPSLLLKGLEFQLKEKGEDRPPLLPKPSATGR